MNWRGFAQTRLAGDTLLGSRAAVAAFAGADVNAVRRHCLPIACDVATRALLYDLDDAVARLATRRPRALLDA